MQTRLYIYETYVRYSGMELKWEEIDELLNISGNERNRITVSILVVFLDLRSIECSFELIGMNEITKRLKSLRKLHFRGKICKVILNKISALITINWQRSVCYDRKY
ncbi:hypothetical protein [Bacillus wiedmannii]|uniref:hypothetical protein n=1 Tax=Bacillus wiedmannii TaxID=1890302 RepID=UPI002E20FB05|nr:hypothetical protein [Bacillus wiedmannii]